MCGVRYGISSVEGGGGGYKGVDIPEFPPWSLEVSVRVIDEGEDDNDGIVDKGVDVLEVVEATVMAGRNLSSGPLL